MSITATILNNRFTNVHINITFNSNGKMMLHTFLAEINKRLQTSTDERHQHVAGVMNMVMGDALRLAYMDFDKFCEKYEVSIHYRDNIDTSNVFKLVITEKGWVSCTREYLFTNLKRS